MPFFFFCVKFYALFDTLRKIYLITLTALLYNGMDFIARFLFFCASYFGTILALLKSVHDKEANKVILEQTKSEFLKETEF